MIDKNLVKELEELLNGAIDPSLFPYKKGNSIRIGSFVVRSNKAGIYKVFDLEDNSMVAEMFCKTSAVALAKSLSKGNTNCNSIYKIDKELQKWYNDCVFYKYTIRTTKDPIKQEVVRTRYDIARHMTDAARRQLDRYIYA